MVSLLSSVSRSPAGRCRPRAASTTRIVAQAEDANNFAPAHSRRDAVPSFARMLVTARHVFVGLSCAKVGERWSGRRAIRKSCRARASHVERTAEGADDAEGFRGT